MKSLSSVGLSARLSVRPFIRPSLTFLKIGSLDFSDVVHDDSWRWHLVTDEEKMFGGPILGPTRLNQAQN